MNPLVQLRFCGCLSLGLFIVACGEPKLQKKSVETEKGEMPDRVEVSPPPQIENAAVPPVHPASEQDEEDLPLAEPELSVVMEGEKITITGALKSQIQQERIIETMIREFPDHIIESDLKVEYHRVAVGWGNRVADAFLVPFFKEAKSPKLSYRERILTLGGRVENARRHRILTEMAIETFSGDSTESVDNQIVTEP